MRWKTSEVIIVSESVVITSDVYHHTVKLYSNSKITKWYIMLEYIVFVYIIRLYIIWFKNICIGNLPMIDKKKIIEGRFVHVDCSKFKGAVSG